MNGVELQGLACEWRVSEGFPKQKNMNSISHPRGCWSLRPKAMKNRALIVAVFLAVGSSLDAQLTYTPYTFDVLASGNTAGGYGTGNAAQSFEPKGVAVDQTGNIYVADWGNEIIWEITPAGVMSPLAGALGAQGYANGTGGAARFYGPRGVAVDGAGNVYVADTGNDRIRKITPGGAVTTLAGGGYGDGTGAAAGFNEPEGVAVDAAGNVYVADTGNDTIRKITPGGVVTTLAGTAGGFGSADGTGAAARFADPQSLAVDGAGNVYVADSQNNTIRKITPDGVVSVLAGMATLPGHVDGTGSAARFYIPVGVAIDAAGNLYVADGVNQLIRKVTPGGVVTTLAGGSGAEEGGTGSTAGIIQPEGIAVDGAGNVYVSNGFAEIIEKGAAVTLYTFTTLAGNAAAPVGSTDGTGSAARFNAPNGMIADGSGNIYVADYGNNTVRKIMPGGQVTTVAGQAGTVGSADGMGSNARFNSPSWVAMDGAGNLYVTDFGNDTIRKITPGGMVSTLAGTAGVSGRSDGTGNSAQFDGPSGIAVDSAGNVYVGDFYNNTIRKITPGGAVTTLAGTPVGGGAFDGTGSAARFNGPGGLAVDGEGNVYVADIFNNAIRKVTPAGVVTTLAGQAAQAGSMDNQGDYATFNNPIALAIDGGGNLYVADYGNDTIRKLTPGGAAATLAGLAGQAGSADGIGSAARFDEPSGVAVDGAGNLYVADTNNNTIRKGVPLAMPVQPSSQMVAAGGTVVFDAAASGGANFAYQWYANGVAIAGATSPMLVVQATATSAGSYACLATDSSGSVLSNTAALTVIAAPPNPGRLINLSTLAVAGGGSQTLTVGFFIGGTGTTGAQRLLVQALGPTVSTMGVSGVMPDPQLNVFEGQTVISSNTGWGAPLSNQTAVMAADAATYATALSDTTSKDSAVVVPLAPGGYTVQVSSVSGTTGKTLTAFYDDTASGTYTATTPRLINLSCRLIVGTNSSLTAGFWIGGTTAKTVLVRADGPALTAQNVTGVMPDPQLTVYNSADTAIAYNAGWGGSPVLSSVAASVYAQPFTDPNSKDSEVLLTLAPGGYTAQVGSASNTAGNVMIEVYEVP
jgi:streptogramin lyase